jgi:hypothetical protein
MQENRSGNILPSGVGRFIQTLVTEWKTAFADKVFRTKLLAAPVVFMVYSAITQRLNFLAETRQGTRLEDKLLTLFPSVDFSTWIFVLLYLSLGTMVLTHILKPSVIMRVIEMHLLVAVVRQLCIMMIALEPPAGIIVLRDVFLENTVYPNEAPLTKDLFFSGHVASIWIYFLCCEKKYLKYVLIGSTILMSFMLLSMRVHYTYDVYGAVLITSAIYFAPSAIRSFRNRRQLQSAPQPGVTRRRHGGIL